MPVKPIPDGYHSITPYFVLPDAGDFIAFMTNAFGATERGRHLGPDGKIMHAEVQIGDSVVMLGEATEVFRQKPMNTHVYVEDVDSVYRQAVAAGAETMREPAGQPYGDRSAGVRDRWGNEWWLATHVEDVSPEELERRMKAGAPS
jgi:PhnB protein